MLFYKFPLHILLILSYTKAYIIPVANITEVLNRAQRDQFSSQTVTLVNNSNLVGEEGWVEEGQFTETYFDMIGNLAGNYLSERSVKNESKRSAPDQTLLELKSLLGKHFKDAKNFNKRDVKDFEKKGKSLHKPTQRRVSTTIRGASLWEEWTPWSTCSVTCGKGRHIRWRHCRDHCDEAETEMEEKTCQMPACPQKLFGLIKL